MSRPSLLRLPVAAGLCAAAALFAFCASAGADGSTSSSDTSTVSGQVQAEIAISATDPQTMTLKRSVVGTAEGTVSITSTLTDWNLSVRDQNSVSPGYLARTAGSGSLFLSNPLELSIPFAGQIYLSGSGQTVRDGQLNETLNVPYSQPLALNDNVLAGDSYATTLVYSVAAGPNAGLDSLPEAIEYPALSGTAAKGQTLTATQGSWDGYPAPTISTQWQMSANGTNAWSQINPTTATTLELGATHVGNYIRFKVTATNREGTTTEYTAVKGPVTEPASSQSPPALSGTEMLGQTLSVTDGAWAGYPQPNITYRWQRSDDGSSGWADIGGATASSYQLTSSDVGKYLRVRVTGANATGTETVSSNVSGAIGQEPTQPQDSPPPSASGDAAVGATLTADPGTWTGFPQPTISYQWQRGSEGAGATSGPSSQALVWTNIAGATAQSYQLTVSDAGYLIRVRVTASSASGDTVVYSDSYGPTSRAPSNTTAPQLSGAARVGEVVSTSLGQWAGYPTPTRSVQWQSSATGTGGWADITDATAADYSVASDQAGKYLRARVRASNSSGTEDAFTQVSTQVTQQPVNDSAPTVSGAARTGQTLSASAGSWSAFPSPDFAYQWQSSQTGTGGWVDITGATESSFQVTVGQAGSYLRIKVTADNGVVASVSAVSQATSMVTDAPVNTAAPAVSGVATTGQSLTTSQGSWTGTPTPTISYQWQRSANGTSGWADIDGATSSSLPLTASLAGSYLRVRVSASNSAGSASSFSDATAMVTDAPAYSGTLSVPATSEYGTTVTATSTLDFTGTPAPTVSYQWQSSSDGSSWTSVNGASSLSYAVPSSISQLGLYLRLRASATNVAGTSTTYSQTARVTGLKSGAIPSVSGTARTGNTLTATAGSWDSYPSISSYSYQWQVSSDGTSGWASASGTGNATSSYTVAAADAGKYLRVQVTASNGVSSDVTARSSATSQVTDAPSNTSAPTISGTVQTGNTLTATSGTWSGTPTPTYTYQWQGSADGSTGWADISGATSSTYLVASAQAGNYLRVRVSADNSVGSPVSAFSSATSQVTDSPAYTGTLTSPSTKEYGTTVTATSTLAWTGTPTPSTSLQWQSSSDGSTWSDISSANSLSYAIPATTNQIGLYLRLRSRATNTAGTTDTYSGVARVTGLSSSANPSVTGTIQTGSTLTASTGTWTSYPSATYAYQWQTSNDGSTGWSDIASATSSTYSVASSQAGKYLRVKVTASNGVSASAVAYSSSTSQVTDAPANTAAPAVSGTAQTGQTLTATSGTWTGTPTPTYTYQWQSSSDGSTGWADISLATSSTYAVASSQAGKYLRVRVRASNAAGTTDAFSSATSSVTDAPAYTGSLTAPATQAYNTTITATSTLSWTGTPTPTTSLQWQSSSDGSTYSDISGATSLSYAIPNNTNQIGLYLRLRARATNTAGTTDAYSGAARVTGLASSANPAVSGTAQTGQVLTASTGSWTSYPSVTGYSYQWQVSNDGSTGWASASGTGNATSSYTVASADTGKYLRVQVTASNGVSANAAASSAATSQVTDAPANTSAPTITGTTTEGQTLTVSDGTWSGTPSPTVSSRQWYRCTSTYTAQATAGANCSAISGATASTYTLTASDVGKYITASISFSNTVGTQAHFAATSASIAAAFSAACTGCTVTTPGDGYTYYTFTSTGSGSLQVSGSKTSEYLVVGGGGAGGNPTAGNASGGGGAGGVLTSSTTYSSGTYAVNVGAGGVAASSTAGSGGGAGGSSSLAIPGSTITASGGGGGAGGASAGGAGGSGGGASSAFGSSAGLGTAGQGNNGGARSNSSYGSGGGGKTSAGVIGSSTTPGNGGNGGTYLGRTVGGGGGGAFATGGIQFAGTGGIGGGGQGGHLGGEQTSGAPNTGGGGGGIAYNGGARTTGGSGIVVIRFPV